MSSCEGKRVLSVCRGFSLFTLCLLMFVCRGHAQTQQCSVNCPYFSRCFRTSPACRNFYQRCGCERRTTNGPSPTTIPSTVSPSLPPPSSARECGVSPVTGPAFSFLTSSRIIGGQRTSDCQFPWMAVVRSTQGFCGGTVIDDRHVLTAAHCVVRRNSVVNPRLLRIGVGSSRQSRTRRIPAIRVTVHPRYRSGRYADDIAVVTLSQPLRWTRCLSPLCLPDPGDATTPGQECVTAGWGLSRERNPRTEANLRSVKVPIVDNSVCGRLYRRIAPITKNHVCAGNIRTGGRDACSGDSGGPMMCGSGNQWKIMGVVSFGRGCGRRGSPGVYTYVPSYLTWIHSVTG